jgi:hypothetical protein
LLKPVIRFGVGFKPTGRLFCVNFATLKLED